MSLLSLLGQHAVLKVLQVHWAPGRHRRMWGKAWCEPEEGQSPTLAHFSNVVLAVLRPVTLLESISLVQAGEEEA